MIIIIIITINKLILIDFNFVSGYVSARHKKLWEKPNSTLRWALYH